MTTTVATTGLHRELGLTDEELAAIEARLGRSPTYTELAMFSVMWSEHCSYKSSRAHLGSLPTEAPHVVVGPGEGAGIVEVAPGVRVAFKIESHNHPSLVEPSSGAATGVGGIVRDILSMGARPIALLDSLRFGLLDDAHARYLVDGIVSGISSYGNSIGVPTVGGEMVFEDCYAENPLVNVACLGVIEDRVMHGRAEGPGRAVVLIGSSTGRDGIGGASVLASAGFDDASSSKRPSVQVGDPFAEKLLIEACLELTRKDLIAGLQDLGAGGISCPVSEMPAKAGTGMSIDISAVRRREEGMEAFEVMISESQERMLAVVEPAKLEAVLGVCAEWELEACVLGEVTDSGRLEVRDGGDIVADVPAASLSEEAPLYERPARRPEWLARLRSAPAGDDPPPDLRAALATVLASPGVASKRWAWEQYDHMIFLGTMRGPGEDAAVLRLAGSDVAVAMSVDGPGRYCYLDPYEGTRLAVAEAARNVAVTGARPLAVTNCLNFGNPEKPEVMWQFQEAVRGLGDACRALDLPVTGGNVSFYNETKGRAIYPTPVIGVLGALTPADASVGCGFSRAGDAIVLLGATHPEDLGGSDFAALVHGIVAGRPPRLDIEAERRLHRLLQKAAARSLMVSAHDCSGGGLAVALVESALAGEVGFAVTLPHGAAHRVLFSESASRALVTARAEAAQALVTLAAEGGVPVVVIGEVGGLTCDFGGFSVALDEATNSYETALGRALAD